jgi:hypothetical protein
MGLRLAAQAIPTVIANLPQDPELRELYLATHL